MTINNIISKSEGQLPSSQSESPTSRCLIPILRSANVFSSIDPTRTHVGIGNSGYALQNGRIKKFAVPQTKLQKTVHGVFFHCKTPSGTKNPKGADNVCKKAIRLGNNELCARLVCPLNTLYKNEQRRALKLKSWRILNSLRGTPGIVEHYAEATRKNKRGFDQLISYQKLYDGDLYSLEEGAFDKPVDERVCERMAGQLLEGLVAMHAKGIYHRDLKLDNILVDKAREQLAIADLDFACEWGVDTAEELNKPCGTPYALSPERAKMCQISPDRRPAFTQEDLEKNDVWGMGIVLYSLYHPLQLPPALGHLSNLRPREQLRAAATVDEFAKSKASRAAALSTTEEEKALAFAMAETAAYVPPGSSNTNRIFGVISKMLRFDPRQRISAREALQELRQVIAQTPAI